MKNPRKMPVIRVEIGFPDGEVVGEWTMDAVGEAPAFLRPGHGDLSPPDWLDEPQRRWTHPQSPVTFTGKVKPGREAEARAALGSRAIRRST